MSTQAEIPASSFILEPLLVASLLTGSALLNRRRSAQIRDVQALTHTTPDPSTADIDADEAKEFALAPTPTSHNAQGGRMMRFLAWTMRVPDNAIFRARIFSRFLMMFPFVMEIWYWLLTYWTYQIARACQALTMGENTRVLAEDHSRWILAVEQALHIDVERGLQGLVMRSDALLWFFNKTYAMVHIPATITFMGYAFAFFPSAAFQSTRRTLVLSNCIAFVVFSLWPCMPPRLLPKDMGYIDTLHVGAAASIWTTNKLIPQFQNQLAAFPSLHFGYSFVIGVSIIAYSPHRWLKLIAPLYPILILLVIMATANHYLLDAVGGFLVTCLAYRVNRVLLNLRPVEEWFFWLLRTERPMDKARYEEVLERADSGSAHGGTGSATYRPLMQESV